MKLITLFPYQTLQQNEDEWFIVGQLNERGGIIRNPIGMTTYESGEEHSKEGNYQETEEGWRILVVQDLIVPRGDRPDIINNAFIQTAEQGHTKVQPEYLGALREQDPK
jgi:hypothetical protein